MSSEIAKPASRERLAGVLAANAASRPLNLVVLLGTMGGGVAVGSPVLLALAVALVIYCAACVRTFFDADEAERVAAAMRKDRRARREHSLKRLDSSELAPEIRRHLVAARDSERRIRGTIDAAQLPYVEVSEEVDTLVTLMDQSARRAQLLDEALRDTPTAHVHERLRELENSGKSELIDALEHQLAVQEKMQAHLQKFYDEMERVVVELDTIRGNLLSVAASTDAGNQQRVAAEVRSLRDEVGALSSGMDVVFGQQ